MNETPRGTGATVLGIIGIVLYAATGILYLSAGLVVPGPWLFLLWAIWLAGLWLLVAVFRRRRSWTPLVAVLAVAFWWLYVTLGETLLGWTA
jgi:hypothetical protein